MTPTEIVEMVLAREWESWALLALLIAVFAAILYAWHMILNVAYPPRKTVRRYRERF